MTLSPPLFEIYLIDTCSLLTLDGRHRIPATSTYSTKERVKIWDGLDQLADEGRLKVIAQVAKELTKYHPNALARLHTFPGTELVLPRSPKLFLEHQKITARHPDLVKRAGLRKKEPADPWLILAAEKYNYAIISDEFRKSERTTKVRSKLREDRIPEVCAIRGIRCLKLRELAEDLEWI